MHKEPTAVICLSPYSGGMELDAILFAKKLVPYTKTIMIVQKDHFIDKKLQEDSLTFETIAFFKSISPSIIFRTREIILKYGIKNVVFFGASELKSLYFSFLGLDINLIIRHGTTKTRPKKDWFHRLIYSKVTHHVCISKHLEDNIKNIIPFGKESLSNVIYPSYNIPKLLKEKHEQLVLVHVGRIAGGKGQVDAIQACQILIDNNIDFELNIVGGYEESYRNEFEYFYDKCNYQDKINLVGFSDDVDSYLSNADIFLFPSYGEGFGNAFIEAMSFNLVCISYNNTTFPYFKNMGFHMHMANNKDVNNLSKRLLFIALNLKKEKEKSKKNRALVGKLFSLEQEVNDYLEILE